jgi:hypothetical protein
MFEMIFIFGKSLMVGVRTSIAALLLLPILSACAKSDVPVSIHGVNYSGEIFRYFVVDPNDEKNNGGGETIDPYGAGGTMCCFSLPKKWRPGIKVQINATHWVSNKTDDRLQEVSETKIVEVPNYLNGKPGELWVLRGEKGDLSLISSDYQPDHVKWPGKIKGWPIPSVEYRRVRWQVYMDHELSGVRTFEKALADIKESPQMVAQEEWQLSKKYDPKSLALYTGPEDPRYIESLKKNYQDGLVRSRKNVEDLRRERP